MSKEEHHTVQTGRQHVCSIQVRRTALITLSPTCYKSICLH